MKNKKLHLPWYKRLLLWLSKPLRLYMAYRFKVAIYKDIALAEADLRQRKPHWSEKMIRNRARQKYIHELKIIGAV